MSQPRVFISYSWNLWEGPGHEEWVLALATKLRGSAVNVRLDKWLTNPGESLSQFMEEEVCSADFVIAVCTPAFAKKVNERSGATGYEQQIVSGQILAGAARSKFIPILRKGSSKLGDDCALPNIFLGTIYLDFRDDSNFEQSLEDLIRAIYDARKLTPPPVRDSPPDFVKRAKEHAGLSHAEIDIELDSDFQLVGGEEAATKQIQVMRAYLSAGIKPSLNIRLPPLDPQIKRFFELSRALSEGQITALEVEEYLTTKKSLLNHQILFESGSQLFSRIDDYKKALIAVASLPDLLSSHLSDNELASIWYLFTKRESRGFNYPDGARFDIYPKSHRHSCIMHLSKEETVDLESAEGMPIRFMTDQWGLNVGLLPRDVLLTRAIPAVVQDFIRHRRWTAKPMEMTEFFEGYPWSMGLH